MNRTGVFTNMTEFLLSLRNCSIILLGHASLGLLLTTACSKGHFKSGVDHEESAEEANQDEALPQESSGQPSEEKQPQQATEDASPANPAMPQQAEAATPNTSKPEEKSPLPPVVAPKIKVGVNFDDGGLYGTVTAPDTNDSILCFTGDFAMDAKTGGILSNSNQNITVALSHRGACADSANIQVSSASGVVKMQNRYTTTRNALKSFTITLEKGDVLQVSLAVGNGCAMAGKVLTMNDKKSAKVMMAQCAAPVAGTSP